MEAPGSKWPVFIGNYMASAMSEGMDLRCEANPSAGPGGAVAPGEGGAGSRPGPGRASGGGTHARQGAAALRGRGASWQAWRASACGFGAPPPARVGGAQWLPRGRQSRHAGGGRTPGGGGRDRRDLPWAL